MMRAMAVAAILASSSSVQAEELDCAFFSKVAEKVMEARQVGVSMTSVMGAFEKVANDNGFYEGLIMLAYEQPRYSTESAQQRAIEDFRDDTALTCYQTNRDQGN